MTKPEKKVAKMTLEKKVMDIKDLIPYELNNKIHWEKKVNLLANIIEKYSYIDEILVDKNNILIAGHGRLQSLQKMWYDAVEVKILDIDVKDAMALRLLHNKIWEYDTQDNLEAINVELNEIPEILSTLDTNMSELYPEFDVPKYDPSQYNEEWDKDSNDGKTVYIISLDNQDDSILLEQYLDENSITYTKKW